MKDARADVLIVGAGIIGAGIASALSRQGLDVVLVDPGAGEGSSAGNAGLVVPSYVVPMSTPENLWAGVRSLGSRSAAVTFGWPLGLQTVRWLTRFTLACRAPRVRRDTAVLHRLARESLELYDEMRAGGLDLGLRRRGWLWLLTGSEQTALTKTVEKLRVAGAVCEPVDADGAHTLQPNLGRAVTGGVWFPHESVMDPAHATQVLLEDAIAHGARLVPERVVAVDSRGPTVRTVRTQSRSLEADQFVIATGAASRDTGRLFGVRVPIEPGYGWSVTLDDPSGLLEHALMGVEKHVVISPLPGRIRVTGGMRFGGRGGNRSRDGDITALRAAAEVLVPQLGDLAVVRTWQGARPMTPSGLPIVRRVDARNLVIAAGHGPLGVTLAPSTVKAVTRELVRSPPR